MGAEFGLWHALTYEHFDTCAVPPDEAKARGRQRWLRGAIPEGDVAWILGADGLACRCVFCLKRKAKAHVLAADVAAAAAALLEEEDE